MTGLTALEDALRGVFGPGIGVGVTDPRIDYGGLYPAEEGATTRMAPKRRLEFTSGRHAARTAMADIGVEPAAIVMGDDRAPVWPDGVIGSIAHCGTACISAVARKGSMRSIGLDIEKATPLAVDLWDTICTDTELEWLTAQPTKTLGLRAKQIFTAKEAVYKAQYPLTGQLIGFGDVELDLDQHGTNFTARANTTKFQGQFAQASTLLLAIIKH